MILKFRAFNGRSMEYGGFSIHATGAIDAISPLSALGESYPVMQFTGLTDTNGKDYYLGDIGEFSNGDRFVLSMEDWLEISIEWIGEPECEDQARDLYRIVNAKIIGNIHQHSHLLDKGE